MHLFMYGITDSQRQARREMLIDCTRDDILKAGQSIMHDIENERSCQTIFGANTDRLQFMISRGWSLERFVEGLSLKQEKYVAELPAMEEVGNYAVREANELGAAELK